MSKKNNETDNRVRDGKFGDFARKYIEENYPGEMDMLKLNGTWESFIEQAAVLGSDTNVNRIQTGSYPFSAKETAHDEIQKFIDLNIKTY